MTTTVEQLRTALANPSSGAAGGEWLRDGLARVARDPGAVGALFPAAGRRCGRAPLTRVPGWSADEAARALLLAALPAERAVTEAAALYRYGDAAEKRAVLKALPLLPVGAECVALLADALRSNDPRLVAAALGPYARHLSPEQWRRAVLKCVFMGVPLAAVDRLDERADAELARMLADYEAEQRAAGRRLPEDAAALLSRLTTSGGPTAAAAPDQEGGCASSIPTST